MQYIFLDFEMNNAYMQKGSKFYIKTNPLCKNEIIEFGAVKLNNEFEIIDTFQSFVKPDAYKAVSPQVLKLTKIKVDDLWKAEYFGKVLKKFSKWLETDEDFIIYTWSNSDLHALIENCKFHKIKFEYFRWSNNIIDLQERFGLIYKRIYKNTVGLKTALSHYKIETKVRRHRALEDAKYCAEIFVKMNKRLGIRNIVKLTELIR